jgi:rhodanese-related sulfurtransferase
MGRREISFLAVVLSLGAIALGSIPAMSQEIPKMSKEELQKVLDKPDVIIVDVRSGTDWKASTMKVKGAVREEPDQVDSWINKYPKDKTLIFYCA